MGSKAGCELQLLKIEIFFEVIYTVVHCAVNYCRAVIATVYVYMYLSAASTVLLQVQVAIHNS